MIASTPLEELLRQTLDRLARQERRTDAIEAMLRSAPPALPPRTQPASSAETPPEIPWPRREPAKPLSHPPDLVKELEARLTEAEERIRTAVRLETVGRLVTGVAHDFNNLLTIISGHADVIRAELASGHPLRDAADLIATTAHVAAGMTRQLVLFGKPGAPDPCPVDANAAVRALERTLGRLMGGRVTLELALAESVPLIRIDPGQFDQVVLNLVVNARDAIPDTGAITLRTAAASVENNRMGWPPEIPRGDYVAVTVTDTGMGMTEDVKARIFDLFFTTKGDRGTGLGLSTVREIVSATGGHVEVESTPGWGTSVRIFWPVYPEPGSPLRLVHPKNL